MTMTMTCDPDFLASATVSQAAAPNESRHQINCYMKPSWWGKATVGASTNEECLDCESVARKCVEASTTRSDQRPARTPQKMQNTFATMVAWCALQAAFADV